MFFFRAVIYLLMQRMNSCQAPAEPAGKTGVWVKTEGGQTQAEPAQKAD